MLGAPPSDTLRKNITGLRAPFNRQANLWRPREYVCAVVRLFRDTHSRREKMEFARAQRARRGKRWCAFWP